MITAFLFTVSAAGTLAGKSQLLSEMVWLVWYESDYPRLLGAGYGLAWFSILIIPNLIVTHHCLLWISEDYHCHIV